ncbi:MAG: type II toxin-antitoxin system VapC family toxin [Acidimicrobiia bacterium]
MVELLIGTETGRRIDARIRNHDVNVPAHFDAEVMSALGRMQRSGRIEASEVTGRLGQLEESPFVRHNLQPLLQGAWELRDNLRLVDALYVELATRLTARLITADQSLANACEIAEVPGN